MSLYDQLDLTQLVATVGLEGLHLDHLAGFHSKESTLYVETDLHPIFGNVLSKIDLIGELPIDEHVFTSESSGVAGVEADAIWPEAGFGQYLNHTFCLRRLIYLSMRNKYLSDLSPNSKQTAFQQVTRIITSPTVGISLIFRH